MRAAKLIPPVIALLAGGLAYMVIDYSSSTSALSKPVDRINAAGRIVRVYDVHRLLERRWAVERACPGSAGLQVNDANEILRYLKSGCFNYQNPPQVNVDLETDQGESLLLALTDSIETDSWIDNGGAVGVIHYRAGMLIVEQTAEVQERIADLLVQLDN